MNSELKGFKELIENADKERRILTESEQDEIISACKKHASVHTPNRIGKYNICAVHPYYLELEWDEFFAQLVGIKRDPRPQETLDKVLRTIDRSRYCTILFDSYPYYTIKSHELVDGGIIDKVIFTKHNLGVPCDKNSMNDFCDSELNYIGGAIAYQCLSVVIQEIRKYAPFFSIRPIRDAISYHQPRFWTKVLGHLHLPFYLAVGNKEKVNDIIFHVPSQLYILLRGVESKELL